MVEHPRKLFATKEVKNLLNACGFAESRSTVVVTSVASDAATESERQPNARRQSAGFDRSDLAHVPSMKALRPNISAPVSVGVCSSVAIILAPSSVIGDLAAAVPKLFLTRSVVTADLLSFSLRYHAALIRHHADLNAEDLRTAVIHGSPITVMETKHLVRNVLS